MRRLPSLICVPIGRPLHLKTMVSYPAADIAPAVARMIAAGQTIDLSRASEGVLQTSLAVEIAGAPEARALAWQGLLSFAGAADGLEPLVAALSGADRAKDYLFRYKRLLELQRRQQKFTTLVTDLKQVRAVKFNEYGALFFPDTDETVPTKDIPNYVRDRFREHDPIPFGFPVESMEWTGISEGDLRIELDRKGRNEFDLEAVISQSLAGFDTDAREDIVDERRLWRIVGRWLEESGADASLMLAVDLARWNAMQRVRSVRVLKDVIIPTYDEIDRRGAMQWCRKRVAEINHEMREIVEDWPHQTAL